MADLTNYLKRAELFAGQMKTYQNSKHTRSYNESKKCLQQIIDDVNDGKVIFSPEVKIKFDELIDELKEAGHDIF